MRLVDLATESGISTPYLSLIEQGKRDPNFSVLKSIAKGLDVPLSILVFLATDSDETLGISAELLEKISATAMDLVKASADEKTVL
jgi:transcriptional regulator with XRE-family HTH domain